MKDVLYFRVVLKKKTRSHLTSLFLFISISTILWIFLDFWQQLLLIPQPKKAAWKIGLSTSSFFWWSQVQYKQFEKFTFSWNFALAIEIFIVKFFDLLRPRTWSRCRDFCVYRTRLMALLAKMFTNSTWRVNRSISFHQIDQRYNRSTIEDAPLQIFKGH